AHFPSPVAFRANAGRPRRVPAPGRRSWRRVLARPRPVPYNDGVRETEPDRPPRGGPEGAARDRRLPRPPARRRGRRPHPPRPDPLPEEVPAPGGGPHEQAASREALRDVARAVEELPAEFRAALLLRVEQDLPFARIAEVLGVTEETARWRVFKARRLLLKRL